MKENPSAGTVRVHTAGTASPRCWTPGSSGYRSALQTPDPLVATDLQRCQFVDPGYCGGDEEGSDEEGCLTWMQWHVNDGGNVQHCGIGEEARANRVTSPTPTYRNRLTDATCPEVEMEASLCSLFQQMGGYLRE